MIASIGELKLGVICEEEGVTACLENVGGGQIESSDKLSPCSHSMLSSRSVSVDEIVK